MNLLERVRTLLRANLDTVVEKADDPEKILRQLQIDMRNQLVQVKTQVATAIAEGYKLQKRRREKEAEAEDWLRKAEQAVQHGHDDQARTALTHYNDLLKQAQRYQQSQKEQEQLVTTMRNALQQLEAKYAEVETTLELLAARKRNALIQQRVFEALNKTGSVQEHERTAKAQDAILSAEARAQALAELHKRNIGTHLEHLSTEQFIEQQLGEIKAKNQPAQIPQHLPTEEPQASSLPPSQAERATPVETSEAAEQEATQDAEIRQGDLGYLQGLLDALHHLPTKE
jgi:phage shock protein A